MSNVNKKLEKGFQKKKIVPRSGDFMIYPQVNQKQEGKIWLSKNPKRIIPIFTPLIVLIDFYIQIYIQT